jgi:hypothetical protein
VRLFRDIRVEAEPDAADHRPDPKSAKLTRAIG